MSITDTTFQKAKSLHLSITEATRVAGVSKRNIYNAKMYVQIEVENMLPTERKHLISLQNMCKKVERDNKRIMAWK